MLLVVLCLMFVVIYLCLILVACCCLMFGLFLCDVVCWSVVRCLLFGVCGLLFIVLCCLSVVCSLLFAGVCFCLSFYVCLRLLNVPRLPLFVVCCVC